LIWVVLAACDREEPEQLTAEQLRDPKACQECHPDHYQQWSGSMHAYASEDPVFRAMNAMGQRETGGELGDFCVKCHAPAAVALGETVDGSDLDALPAEMQGVTCWYCHQVQSVDGEHNNPLSVAKDRVMRGPFGDPVPTDAHESAYSALHDREDLDSSSMCGSCHDIVTPLGGHIERTYSEWQQSLFAKPVFGLSCASCHMQGREGLAAEADEVKLRRVHDHAMPGVDVALTPWPEADTQRALVQELLDDSLNAFLCVSPPGEPTLAVVTLENVAAGHMFPSGASADRRVWVEIVAYEGGQEIWRSGADPADEADTDLWRIWSTLLDSEGAPTHKFWEAADIESSGLLPVQTTLDVQDPAYVSTHVSHNYLVRGGTPDRVTAEVHVQPIGLEVLDELVASGDLDPAVRDAMPTFTLAPTRLEWTPAVPVNAGSLACVPQPPPIPEETAR
jgi:hypothetical protein